MRSAIWMLAGALLLAACGEAPEPPAPLRSVLVKRVEPAELGAPSVLTGEVRARHEADLAFRVGGKMVERRVDVGGLVTRGQLLARLDPRDVELAAVAAQAAVAAAESDLGLARLEYDRARDLRARNFVSGSVLDARTATLRAAEARLAQARAQASAASNQAAYASLAADAAGVVTAVLAEPGQVVGAGQTVLRVARSGEREVLVYLPESRRRELTEGATVEVRPWAEASRSYSGKVREVAPAADAVTRTYALRVGVPGADEALPLGATAVVVFAGRPGGRLLLPLPAVTRHGDAASVWVVDGDGRVQPRPVVVASYRDDGVVVRSGLAANDQVVVAGAHTLEPGQQVRVVDERAPVALDVKR